MNKFFGIILLAISVVLVAHGTIYAQNRPRPVTYQDLMLGGISYNDSVSSISRRLNESPKIEKMSNVITYIFSRSCIRVTEYTYTDRKSDWQISVYGKSALQTPRGIHVNSSLNDVISAYGQTQYKADTGDWLIYAYPTNTTNGSPGIEFFVDPSSRSVKVIRCNKINMNFYKIYNR